MYFLRPAIERTRHLRKSLLNSCFFQGFHHRGHREHRAGRIKTRDPFPRSPRATQIPLHIQCFYYLLVTEVSPKQLWPDSLSTALCGGASLLSVNLSPNANLAGKVAPPTATVRNSRQRCAPTEGGVKRAGEKGAGYLKPVLWTLVLASLVYVGIKVVPVLVAEFEFLDGMQTIARFASANGQSAEKIHDAVLKEAEKDELPVGKDDIKVTGTHGNVRINVDYAVTVDLMVYQWTLNFHPTVNNDSLF